jgi:two-component system sensor histidine kinase DesK
MTEKVGTWRFEQSDRAALLAFLLFLYFPLAELHRESLGTGHRALILAAFAVFLATYVSLMWAGATPLANWHEWMRLGILIAIAVALALDNSAEWVGLFIYVAAVSGRRLPWPYAVPTILANAALAAAAGIFGDYEVNQTIALSIYVLAVGFMLLAFARLHQANSELREARQEIGRLAVNEERLRFARDLHDLLGHSLSVITLKSQLAGRLVGHEPHRAATEVAEIERISRDALREVREAVAGYRKMTLHDELNGAHTALLAAGIETTIERVDVAFSPETEAILAWAVREATTNVISHSGARHCEIRIKAGLTTADVEVLDDGAGRKDHSGGGSGLAGLAERVGPHGRVEASRRSEGGFRLHVTVPTA